MVEKRPYAGDHGSSPNGVKRPKPTTGGPANPADIVAAAKAKAAQKAAEIKARMAGGAGLNGAATTPTPPSQTTSAGASASDRLAAMKARMAALKNGSAQGVAASSSSTAAPPVRPPASRGDDLKAAPNEPHGPRFATTLGNRRTDSPLPAHKSQKPKPASKQEETKENPYYDPKALPVGKSTRVSRSLVFNQQGKYVAEASRLREREKLEQLKALLAKRNRQAKLDENSERGFIVPPPPPVEWWDEGLLEEKTYDCIDEPSKVKIDSDESMITLYVQHPVLLKAPQDQLLIPVKPMYLTSKEQAKLRRMRRAEEHKEQQAKIRLGLEPPPPPKVKRGNMMRVMGEQAIADPTAVEMLVEAQIAEREDAHVMANEERKLSKEQRHEKIKSNQERDAQKGLHMVVFKINSLAFGKHRYQIDQNAKQHSLTGITIFHRSQNLVIVEGGMHSIASFKKLMLNRIKWGDNALPTEIQMEKQAADPEWMKSFDDAGHLKDLSNNKCTLVFEGEIKQRAFRKWGSKMCDSDGEAKEVLARSKLDSLWALAKSME